MFAQTSFRFNRFPTMASRYVLMNLLGKGGFSEVFFFFSLIVHFLTAIRCIKRMILWNFVPLRSRFMNLTVSGPKKRRRECSWSTSTFIVAYAPVSGQLYASCDPWEFYSKDSWPLSRCSIVSFCPISCSVFAYNSSHHRFDVFELSADCFCTVLEFCEGSDLDLVRLVIHSHFTSNCVTRFQVLKTNKFLPEREARSIIVQVLSTVFWSRFGQSWFSYFMCCRLYPLCATWICRWLHQIVTNMVCIVDSFVSEKHNYSLRFETCQRPHTSRRGARDDGYFFLHSTFVLDAFLHRSKLPTLVFQKLCQKRSTL